MEDDSNPLLAKGMATAKSLLCCKASARYGSTVQSWQFDDKDLEARYTLFVVKGRQAVVIAVALVGCVFSLSLAILLGLNWDCSYWLGDVSNRNPSGIDLTGYYSLKLCGHLFLFIGFASGIVSVVLKQTQTRWAAVSTTLCAWLLFVALGSVLASTFAGLFQLQFLAGWANTTLPSSTNITELRSLVGSTVDISVEITDSITSNSVSLLLGPIFALIFLPPAKRYVIMVCIVMAIYIIPNWAVCWMVYHEKEVVVRIISDNTFDAEETNRYNQYYDLMHTLLQ